MTWKLSATKTKLKGCHLPCILCPVLFLIYRIGYLLGNHMYRIWLLPRLLVYRCTSVFLKPTHSECNFQNTRFPAYDANPNRPVQVDLVTHKLWQWKKDTFRQLPSRFSKTKGKNCGWNELATAGGFHSILHFNADVCTLIFIGVGRGGAEKSWYSGTLGGRTGRRGGGGKPEPEILDQFLRRTNQISW